MLLENLRKLTGMALLVAPIVAIRWNLSGFGLPRWLDLLAIMGLLGVTAFGWWFWHR